MKAERLSEILPKGLAPRLLTKEQAAAYCGVSVNTLSAWIGNGIVPGPLRGTGRFDRVAIDRALDKLSGCEAKLSPLDEWRQRHGQGTA